MGIRSITPGAADKLYQKLRVKNGKESQRVGDLCDGCRSESMEYHEALQRPRAHIEPIQEDGFVVPGQANTASDARGAYEAGRGRRLCRFSLDRNGVHGELLVASQAG
jgi:hypothetical protein